MKALSIRQPWAWAIMAGHKKVENRSWSTLHRGPLLIHAAKAIDLAGFRLCRELGIQVPEQLPLGAILGQVELYDVVESLDSPWFVGPMGFLVRDPRPLAEPLPWTGRLGLFEVEGVA